MLEEEVKRDIQHGQAEKDRQGNIFEHNTDGSKSDTGRRNALPFHISGAFISFYHATMIAGAANHA